MASQRTIAWLFYGTALTGLVLAQWPDSFSAPACGLALLFVVGSSLLFLLNLRRRAFGSLLVVSLFSLVYAYRLLYALEHGDRRLQMVVLAVDIQSAIGDLLVFLLTLTAGAWVVRWTLGRIRWMPRLLRPLTSSSWTRGLWVGLFVCLCVTTTAAFAAGMWTYYGAESLATEGGVRPELLYPLVLITYSLILVRRLVESWRKGLGLARPGALLLLTVGLLWALQMRRLLIALGVGAVEVALLEGLPLRVLFARPSRAVASLASLLLLGFLTTSGSQAWRSSTSASPAARVEDVAGRLASGQYEESPDRFTYLWLDGAAVHYQEPLQGQFTLDEAAWSSLANATPAILFPGKYAYPVVQCEAAFQVLGMDEDLPCTPTAEGYLADGVWGVVLVGLGWSLFVGTADWLWGLGGVLPVSLAIMLVAPMFVIEAGAFPVFVGLRDALIVSSVMGAVGWAVRTLLRLAPP